ncbi:MAG TPA: hypothetical protein VJX28_05825 [Chthoniobacterales bacterium]|nr:hypothetical protein [Chthoniobacterales bacterium]
MIVCHAALFAILWASIRTEAIGRPGDSSDAARNLARQAAPYATDEYCGSFVYRNIEYYLFVLEQNELSGLVLIRQQAGSEPIIIDADTSFFPVRNGQEPVLDKVVLDGVEVLLQKRAVSKKSGEPIANSTRYTEVSFIGDAIDRVVYPITGFRLESDATRQILQRLRTGSAVEVAPKTAPPGSIIVSPTTFSRSGPVYLGHAGIVGPDGSIYSADARFGGAWTKNVSVAEWLKRFAGKNGCYAFVLRAPLKADAQNSRPPVRLSRIAP